LKFIGKFSAKSQEKTKAKLCGLKVSVKRREWMESSRGDAEKVSGFVH
jgi:hypothetical protein